MLYAKIQPKSFLGSEEEDFKEFIPYMDMAAILISGAKPFEQIGKTLLTEGPMWNLVKIAQAVSEKKTFKNYTIYTGIDPRARTEYLRGQNFNYQNVLLL